MFINTRICQPHRLLQYFFLFSLIPFPSNEITHILNLLLDVIQGPESHFESKTVTVIQSRLITFNHTKKQYLIRCFFFLFNLKTISWTIPEFKIINTYDSHIMFPNFSSQTSSTSVCLFRFYAFFKAQLNIIFFMRTCLLQCIMISCYTR